MIINNTPTDDLPLVQLIDNFARNDKLANVLGAKEGKGSLLDCTLNFRDSSLPETTSFLKSLYGYADSKDFHPKQTLDKATPNELLFPT